MGPGGQVINEVNIEDFPGFPEGIAGYSLGPLALEQAQAMGVDFLMDQVTALEPGSSRHLVRLGASELSAKGVIIASGSDRRRLGVPGEEEFEGRGVSYCASCDGPFFQDQTVCVVGGGDSALGEALVLTDYASRVLLLHRGDSFRAQHAFQRRVEDARKIEIRWHSELEEILGDAGVENVRVKNTKTQEHYEEQLSAVFVEVGLEPSTQFLQGVVPLDGSGHIPTNVWMETEVPGIFAAGDVRQNSASQLVAAAGDGATAAVAAYRYIASHG